MPEKQSGAAPKLAHFAPRGYILSHLSAVHACIDRLGIGVPTAWLYGVTGYAFMLNIPKGVSCAGPTLWNWRSIKDRTQYLGVDLSDFVFAHRDDADFADQRKKGRAFTEENLAAGAPLYGCELGFPEFYVVRSCGDTGFTYAWMNLMEMQPVTGNTAWEEFGVKDVGVLFVGAAKKAGASDDARAIAEALAFAVEVGHAKPGYLEGTNVGLRGYDTWIASLTDGSLKEGPWCHPHGTTHNAACWWECRSHAGEFLVLCARAVGGELASRLLRASEHYRSSAAALARVRAWWPWGMPGELPSDELVGKTTKELRSAKESESRGLELLDTVRGRL